MDGRRKLTDEQVRAIRNNRNGMTDAARAKMYGVHKNTIWLVRNRVNLVKVPD
jgi:transposase